jgi:hypothetical protein
MASPWPERATQRIVHSAVSQRWSARASAQLVVARSATLLLCVGPALQLSRAGRLVLQLQAPVAGALAGSTLGIGLAWQTP